MHIEPSVARNLVTQAQKNISRIIILYVVLWGASWSRGKLSSHPRLVSKRSDLESSTHQLIFYSYNRLIERTCEAFFQLAWKRHACTFDLACAGVQEMETELASGNCKNGLIQAI